jgi:histidinol-phosphate/aromatic aminotransferase/cobyric acid decarboxylase-like protein/choline kinase
MKAIILTAGFGNRMRPLTFEKHKTLLPVLEHTILGRIIDGLLYNHVRDIVLVTGYRADDIHAYMDDNYGDLDVEYVHNERYAETNNIYSLALAFDNVEIDTDLLIIESDLIYHPSVIDQIIKSPRPNVALVDHFRFGMDGTAVAVKHGVITQVIPPHVQDEHFDHSDKFKTLNIYKFDKDFCNNTFKKLLTYYANAIDDNCYYELILGILIYMQREEVYAEVVGTQEWAEVDDPNDLRVAQFVFDKPGRKDLLDASQGGYWNYPVLDFCFIRNMYFPTGAMFSKLRQNLTALLQNYGSKQSVLNEKLSYALLCNKDNIHVLNGASQVYPVLRRKFADKRVLTPSPTFGEYKRNFPQRQTYRDEIGVDLDEIQRRIEETDVVVFVNPNNPSGFTLPTQALYDFAARNPNKQIIIDESFIEFSDHPSMIGLLEAQALDNVLIIKSLSKSLGVPGLRLGYAYSTNPEMMAEIGAEVPIWNLNSMAEFFLEILLKEKNELRRSYERTKRDRAQFVDLLRQTDFVDTVYPSGGNFLLVKLKQGDSAFGAKVVRALLTRHEIYIKDVSPRFNDGGVFLRFAVRVPREHELLVDKLGQTLIELRDEA